MVSLLKASHLEKEGTAAAVDILDELSSMFLPAKDDKLRQVFYNEVVIPSVKFAHAIQTSLATYEFALDPSSGVFDNRPVSKDALGQIKAIDVASGKQVKKDSPVWSDDEGYIGNTVMVLRPALYRCDPNTPSIRLTQEIWSIELHKPMARRNVVMKGHSDLTRDR